MKNEAIKFHNYIVNNNYKKITDYNICVSYYEKNNSKYTIEEVYNKFKAEEDAEYIRNVTNHCLKNIDKHVYGASFEAANIIIKDLKDFIEEVEIDVNDDGKLFKRMVINFK